MDFLPGEQGQHGKREAGPHPATPAGGSSQLWEDLLEHWFSEEEASRLHLRLANGLGESALMRAGQRQLDRVSYSSKGSTGADEDRSLLSQGAASW